MTEENKETEQETGTADLLEAKSLLHQAYNAYQAVIDWGGAHAVTAILHSDGEKTNPKVEKDLAAATEIALAVLNKPLMEEDGVPVGLRAHMEQQWDRTRSYFSAGQRGRALDAIMYLYSMTQLFAKGGAYNDDGDTETPGDTETDGDTETNAEGTDKPGAEGDVDKREETPEEKAEREAAEKAAGETNGDTGGNTQSPPTDGTTPPA